MILPQPRSRMAGASRRLVSIAAVRSSASVSCQADSGASSRGRMSRTSPALLTRMSIGPPSRAAASVQRCSTCPGSVRSAAIAATGASEARAVSSARGVRAGAVADRDRGAVVHERLADGAADAGGAAGDQGAAAAQVDVQIHHVLLVKDRRILRGYGFAQR